LVVAGLFGGDDAREALEEMDAVISALPGLEGLTLYADAVAAATRRHGPSVTSASWPIPTAALPPLADAAGVPPPAASPGLSPPTASPAC
jgi:hypothetical protein